MDASERTKRKHEKQCLLERCAELDIDVPANARIRQLEAILAAYYEDAVAVHIGNMVDLRQTDKSAAEYIVEFSMTGVFTIRAEDEDAACQWLRDEVDLYTSCNFGSADVYDIEILDVYTDESAEANVAVDSKVATADAISE